MSAIVIHNLKDEPFIEGFYVGRESATRPSSPLGNPYLIGRDGDRDTVCDKYARKMWDLLRRAVSPGATVTDPERVVLTALHELWAEYRKSRELHLLCFCAPLRCHAMTIRDQILWLEREMGPGLDAGQEWRRANSGHWQPR